MSIYQPSLFLFFYLFSHSRFSLLAASSFLLIPMTLMEHFSPSEKSFATHSTTTSTHPLTPRTCRGPFKTTNAWQPQIRMLQVNDGLGLVDGQPTKDGQSTKGQCGVGQPSEGQPCDPSLPSTVNGEWKSLSSVDVEPIWRQGPKKRDTIHTSLPFQRTHRGQHSAKLSYHAMAVMQNYTPIWYPSGLFYL